MKQGGVLASRPKGCEARNTRWGWSEVDIRSCDSTSGPSRRLIDVLHRWFLSDRIDSGMFPSCSFAFLGHGVRLLCIRWSKDCASGSPCGRNSPSARIYEQIFTGSCGQTHTQKYTTHTRLIKARNKRKIETMLHTFVFRRISRI